jgi:teichuronic acid exporter
MSLGHSIRSGVKWLFLGNVGSRFLEFAFGVALARLLVPADFGMIVTISVFTGFAGMVMSGGMGQSLIRAKETSESDFNAVFTMQLAMGIVIYLGFFITAPLIGEYFNNPLYADLLRISTLVFLMRPFAFMRNAWLNREMDFKKRSITGFMSGAITGTASVLMAWFGMGVWSLILSGLLGALSSNIMLALITPLKLSLNFDTAAMRKHSAYGFKITINDFLSYLTRESKNLILSKLAGPAFLGIFNKAESLSRIPNQLIMPATMQPVFRAMSKVQDDLDKTKYMFYRAITLLMVYITPFYVGLWWVAGPFIEVVYGEKWLSVIEPMKIVVIAGFFSNIIFPCGVLLDAQNRLTQEMVVLIARLAVVTAACAIGLRWGPEGVAWGIVISYVFSAVSMYYLAYQTIPTRMRDLFNAITPGLTLNALLFGFLAVVHFSFIGLRATAPAFYLVLMAISGATFYGATFLFIPIPSISNEVQRWREKLKGLRRLPSVNTRFL